MSAKTRKKRAIGKVDLLVILLCLSGAAYFLNLFRLDLFAAISLQNEKPVGTILIRSNIVQRRMSNRVLWDRVRVDSPVYIGDLIRVADQSAATLDIAENQIDLDENTLIRILAAANETEAAFQIELDSGSLSLSSGGSAGLMLTIGKLQLNSGP